MDGYQNTAQRGAFNQSYRTANGAESQHHPAGAARSGPNRFPQARTSLAPGCFQILSAGTLGKLRPVRGAAVARDPGHGLQRIARDSAALLAFSETRARAFAQAHGAF